MISIPTVSVVMPTLNSERYLKEAINSILDQTFTDFEVIIIDDSSIDQTVEIVKSYSDPRIQLLSGNNDGISAALNQGIRYSRGKYIARMDADDISLPDRFKLQVKFLEENPDVGICGTKVIPISSDILYDSNWGDWIKSTPKLIDLLGPVIFCHPTVFFRRSVIDRYGLYYNENLHSAEDQELWFRAIRLTNLYNIDQKLLFYRIHSQNSTKKHFDDGEVILRQLKLDLINWLGIEEFGESSFNQEEVFQDLANKIDENHYLEILQQLRSSRWLKIGKMLGLMKNITF